MSARTGIFNYLTGRALCKVPRPADEAEGLLAAHRAEVLREAAEASAQWNSDCQNCAVELEVARELRRMADEEKATPTGETTPADVTVYRAEYEHEPFLPIGLYANSAAAQAHCEHLVRQEWTPSTPITFEWSVDEDDSAVIELDVRVETDSWSTGYTVKAVVADAEFDPEADS
jgi:hypothetical protein